MTKSEAKKLCLIKWQMIIDNDGDCYNINYPKSIRNLRDKCAYCELYANTSSPKFKRCADCPIRPKLKDYSKYELNNGCLGCICRNSLHRIWVISRTIEAAQALYDLIKDS